MSIIYDALQKTQRQLNVKNQFEVARPYRSWFDLVLYIIIFLLLIVVLFAYAPFIKRYYFSHREVSKPKIAKPVKPIPTGKLTLNGIFISDSEKLAQINNKLVHVGDNIEGNRIVEITASKVKVLNSNGIFYLQANSLSY